MDRATITHLRLKKLSCCYQTEIAKIHLPMQRQEFGLSPSWENWKSSPSTTLNRRKSHGQRSWCPRSMGICKSRTTVSKLKNCCQRLFHCLKINASLRHFFLHVGKFIRNSCPNWQNPVSCDQLSIPCHNCLVSEIMFPFHKTCACNFNYTDDITLARR